MTVSHSSIKTMIFETIEQDRGAGSHNLYGNDMYKKLIQLHKQ